MYKVKLEKFEGPLDLLLQLIEQEDLDINQISLAKIADDFVGYVNKSSGIPLDELSDFLLVASKLIYIKSKALLPYLILDNEEDEALGLEAQLKLYKEFLDASRVLEEAMKKKNYLFAREQAAVPKGFYPPHKLSAGKLAEVFAEILNAITPFRAIQKKAREAVVSIGQKISVLKNLIGEKAHFGFREFVKHAKNKTEIIVSFLALLELIKQKTIDVSQGDLFGDIEISKK